MNLNFSNFKYDYIPFDRFNPRKMWFDREPGYYPKYMANNFISLDTETSHNEDRTESWLYQWCLSYPNMTDPTRRYLVYGRRPSELAETLDMIASVNKTDENHRLSIFVHNLSYDYAYIKEHIEERFGQKGKVLAISNHKILSYEIGGLLFKCTYRLSQKSLDKWGKELGTKHRKLKGTIDYDKVRFQDSSLTKKDWKYMFYDIVCLDECVIKQLNKWNDDFISVPLTNTGYVRREARKEFDKDEFNKAEFKKKALSLETYKFAKCEFAGGLTHGNRFLANETIKGNIRHRDFASHYPSQQICYKAPCSEFKKYYDKTEAERPLYLSHIFEKTDKFCFLVAIAITNLKVKDGVTLPTAQVSKFMMNKIGKVRTIEDNGRLLLMEGTCVIVMNEYDLKWLVKQYNFEYEILKVYRANKGPFPQYLRDTVMRFFYEKSYYKAKEKEMEKNGVPKDSPEYIENHLNMMIAKGMLNSIYGMTATDPVRTSYFENEEGEWKHNVMTEADIEEALGKFYNKKTAFMNYELGCWTTSLARNELLEFVELIGYDNFIYADTDSIFYLSTPEIEDKIEAKNEEFRQKDEENGWYIEVDGKKTYFNQFELEKEEITEFRFLHAKCYAYKVKKEDKVKKEYKEELNVTIAGVSAYGRNGNSRVKELGNIENLEEGMKFIDCGGTATSYLNRRPDIIDIDGHLTEIACAAIIMPTEKTLNDSVTSVEIDFTWEKEE